MINPVKSPDGTNFKNQDGVQFSVFIYPIPGQLLAGYLGWGGGVYSSIHTLPDDFFFQNKFKSINLKRNISGKT